MTRVARSALIRCRLAPVARPVLVGRYISLWERPWLAPSFRSRPRGGFAWVPSRTWDPCWGRWDWGFWKWAD